MNKIIFLYWIIVFKSAFSASYFSEKSAESIMGGGDGYSYSSKDHCEKVEKSECIENPADVNPQAAKVENVNEYKLIDSILSYECKDAQDCLSVFENLKCEKGTERLEIEEQKIYCDIYEAKEVKKLVRDNDKEVAIKAIEDSKKSEENESKNRKRAAKEKMKNFNKNDLTTVAKLRDFVSDLVDLLKE